MTWLASKLIPVIDWPAKSPDQSRIETLWGEIKIKLRRNPARTVGELRQRLQEIWDSFTVADCQKLIKTMPARLKSLVEASGNVTKW